MMIDPRRNRVAFLLESPEEEKLWLGIFGSQGAAAEPLAVSEDLEAIVSDPRLAGARAAVFDLPALALRGVTPEALAAALAPRYPGLAIFVRFPERTGISGPEQAWAHRHGIASLLPGSTVAAWRESLVPVLARLLAAVGAGEPDLARLEPFLNGLMKRGEEPRPGPVKDAHADAYQLERAGLNATRLCEAMQGAGGVPVADRAWRGRTYRDCFVASEAIDWLVARFGVRRAVALRVCRFLWRTGRVHHVLRDSAFADEYLFFRFSGARAELEAIDLGQVEEAMRSAGGVPIQERVHLAKSYPRCFVGSEAVDWLMARYRLRLGAAETVGQRLLELGVFHHVVDEHGFVEGRYFYRFRADEEALTA
ncbi:MAG TPA: hypothetical protein VEG27_02660 [Usitatibacter sp.]|nr:hypothetical protein [Usitatibacter sp.]